MDYLKYKTIKFHNEYKNRKKQLNDTLNNAYTECSEKTAPTYASEAMRSKSGKSFVNNFLEYKKSNFNPINNCDSNRWKDLGNQETILNYNNKNFGNNFTYTNNYKNCQNCSSLSSGNYIDFSQRMKESQSVGNCLKCNNDTKNNYSSHNNNFEIARRKIDEYMEEKLSNKNMKRNSKSFYIIYSFDKLYFNL